MRKSERLVRRRRLVRRVASCFLLFHLAAVIIAPASVDPTSPMWLSAWTIVKPYTQLVFLDQGWNFFSPEPGESTIVSYRAHLPSGEVIEERMPHKQMWPRLLYHRHFMLTSYMGYQPEELQVAMCEGYIDHIKNKHGATEVEFTKWTHWLPTQQHIAEGGRLDHAELWDEDVFEVVSAEDGVEADTSEDDAAERSAQSDNEESRRNTIILDADDRVNNPKAVDDDASPSEKKPKTAA